MKIEVIETNRMILRNYEKEDMKFVLGIWTDPKMGEHLVDPSKEHVTQDYLHAVQTLDESETCIYLIANDKDTNGRIGTCCIVPSEDKRVFDFGYCIHELFW